MTSWFDDNVCIAITLETAMPSCSALSDVMLLSDARSSTAVPLSCKYCLYSDNDTPLLYNSVVVNNRRSFHSLAVVDS